MRREVRQQALQSKICYLEEEAIGNGLADQLDWVFGTRVGLSSTVAGRSWTLEAVRIAVRRASAMSCAQNGIFLMMRRLRARSTVAYLERDPLSGLVPGVMSSNFRGAGKCYVTGRARLAERAECKKAAAQDPVRLTQLFHKPNLWS